MAKKKVTKKPVPQKKPTKAQKLLEAVQGMEESRGKKPTGKPWEPNEIQWAWYVMWTTKQFSFRQIAAVAKREYTTVRDMIYKIQEWEWDALKEERVEIARRQTRALEVTFQEAAKGWERSQENAVTIKTEEISIRGMSSDGDIIEVPGIKETRTEAGQAGDASFLNAQMAALKGIRDIWGVEAPKESKMDLTTGLSTFVGATPEETVRAHLQAELDRIDGATGR